MHTNSANLINRGGICKWETKLNVNKSANDYQFVNILQHVVAYVKSFYSHIYVNSSVDLHNKMQFVTKQCTIFASEVK